MKAAKPIGVLVLLAMLALILFVALWQWQSQRSGILITEATAAPLADQDRTVGVFLTIHNKGAPDRLVSARSIVAQRARLAFAEADAGLPIPTDSEPSLSPDGAYVLMDGVGGELKEGRMIPITLRFENAGEIRTQARLVTPRQTGEARDFGLLGLGGICQVGEGEPAPEIALSITPEGDDWRLQVQAKEFTFSEDMIDGAHVPGMGHAHLYVGGIKLQRLFEPEVLIGALPPGQHLIQVTLNTNDHRAYVVGDDPVTATATIDVPFP